MILEPIVELRNLSKTFGSGEGQVAALQHVSVAVEPGEIFGIIGLSEGNAAKLSFYTFIVFWMDFGLEGWVAGLIAYACYRFFRAAWESDGITH